MHTLRWHDRFIQELPGEQDLVPGSRQVEHAAWSAAKPTAVSAPSVVAWSADVARDLGLSETPGDDAADVLSGNVQIDGMRPYAACYGGHQFGHWAGQLGDGRAITLGEVIGPDGERREVQLKGAGPTPYSRTADGRAVLRSSVREFLCSEAMHHLGVPTTRALALLRTGDPILRDKFYDGRAAYEPGAIVCRIAPSFLRFGSYQIHAARGDEPMLRALVDHTLRAHFPHLGEPSRDSVLAWLHELARSTATMVSEWMRVGFVHGVMNTDNMSVLGLTIDYGPYGWIDGFDPGWTPNTTDAQFRRYRFGAQPDVAGWNLTRLAEAIYPLVQDISALEAVLHTYQDSFAQAHQEVVRRKLGLAVHTTDDDVLYNDLIGLMSRAETDMTLTFRALANVPEASDPLACIEPAFYDADEVNAELRADWRGWLARYATRVEGDGLPTVERRAMCNAANPKYVLRNYLAQEAIELAEQGDHSRIYELQRVLSRPYDEQPEAEAFAARRPEWARHKAGCSTLSCSS